MRRALFLLSLIAACAGPSLRLAEAADDLGRAPASLGADRPVGEEDGGVGDDSGETIRDEPVGAPAVDGAGDMMLAWVTPPMIGPSPPPGRAANPLEWPRAEAPRRLAWLQRFLC